MAKLVFYGTGTSTGVPMPACNCGVCRSENPKDQRLRSCICLELDQNKIIVDTPPDFRTQVLKAGLQQIDAVLLTHGHADHVNGFDDLRPFSFISKKPMPVYLSDPTLQTLKTRFDYIWNPLQQGGGLPQIDIHVIQEQPFCLFDKSIIPLPVWHGRLQVTAFRFGELVYLTDVSDIPAASLEAMHGCKKMIIGTPQWVAHATHFHIARAIQLAQDLQVSNLYLTHLSHQISADQEKELPHWVSLAYDQLELFFDW